MIAWIFAIVVLAFVGKLIYDVQQKKNKPTKNEAEFDKDTFQKLAGIRPVDKNNELHETLVKNNFPKEQIVEALLKAAENSEFPKQDETINVRTTKIGAIDMKSYGDSDPLATIPMSRVSDEGKKKMAEIAKQDINKQVEQNVSKFETLNDGKKACGCGRSETGFCTGLHRIPKKDWAAGVRDIPAEKPKRKYTKKSKA
jgi:CDGSH-type Zn-finger protein